MIKKLLLLKNVIKSASERKMLENLIKEAAEKGHFTSELLEGSVVPDVLIGSLVLKIKKILPNILLKMYHNKTQDEVKAYVNNNAYNILFTKVLLPEAEESGNLSILDHYLYRSSLDYPTEEESVFGIDIMHPTIDVDEPAPDRNTGPLRLMPRGNLDLSVPEYNEEISEEILIDLLYNFVEQEKPFGEIDAETVDLEGEDIEEDDIDEDERERFLRFMNRQN